QRDGEAMINSIQKGDQPLPVIAQVSLAGNKCGYKKDNYELNYKFLNNLQPEWKQYGTLMRQTKNLMDINIDALYNILKQNQGNVNDALVYKKKAVVITSDPLALVVEKMKVSKQKEKVVVSLDSEDPLALAAEKAKVSKRKEKVVVLKDSDEQVLLAEDQAWMESSSDSDQEINANIVFMAQIENVLSDSDESSSSVEETIAEEINANIVFIAQIEKVLSDSDESSSSVEETIAEHMTDNRALLTNFVEKFLGTVHFGNNDFAVIAGYGDVVIGSMTIKKSTCFVRNEDGVDLLTDDRSSNSYTIALNEVASNSLTCLLGKASFLQSWLWHQRVSHLNFTTINNLVKNNLVQGLPKMKFEKDHLCSACEQGKIHRKHHKSKTDFASTKPLYLLHMDLCGLTRIESINGKRYVLVIVDDY
nr:hypothetical protein [Tanacetum cinerariifolium]